MNDRYKSPMADEWFRSLTAREEEKFRQWTRENWSPIVPENFAVFHPVVRDEWMKIDMERLDVLP